MTPAPAKPAAQQMDAVSQAHADACNGPSCACLNEAAEQLELDTAEGWIRARVSAFERFARSQAQS